MILYFCPDCESHSKYAIILFNDKKEVVCKKCGWVGIWDDMIKVETEENQNQLNQLINKNIIVR